MNSRLSRYREEWKLMNGAQRRPLALTLALLPIIVTICCFAVIEQNWLAICLVILVTLLAGQVVLQLRAVSMYRHLYESTRDRPRAENWRQN